MWNLKIEIDVLFSINQISKIRKEENYEKITEDHRSIDDHFSSILKKDLTFKRKLLRYRDFSL